MARVDLARLRRWLGVQTATASYTEQLLSGLGGAFGICGVWLVSHTLLTGPAAAWVIASAAASTVLVFAIPHGNLSQPWAVLGGHLVSALAGVSCAQWLHPQLLAACTAVGLAIVAMYVLRCLHPPGGATALTAVIGGPEIEALGYGFVLTPVLLNMLIVVLLGILFNLPLAQRRYPNTALFDPPHTPGLRTTLPRLDPERLANALNELDTFIDVSEQDLQRIFALATQEPADERDPALELRVGAVYSNGRYGREWQLREIVAIEEGSAEQDEIVRFRIVAGVGRRRLGWSTALAFSLWANHQVYRDESCWRPLLTQARQSCP